MAQDKEQNQFEPLPPRPNPEYVRGDSPSFGEVAFDCYSGMQMLAYGRKCFDAARAPREWQPIETAPIAAEGNFLVERGSPQGYWIEEVFAFQGEMYPARLFDGVDFTQRVLDAQRWMPLPQETTS